MQVVLQCRKSTAGFLQVLQRQVHVEESTAHGGNGKPTRDSSERCIGSQAACNYMYVNRCVCVCVRERERDR